MKRGFTIVELLIVIVVIAVLAAIVVVAYNGIQVRARDAQRTSDIAGIIKALKSYRAVNNQYPVATSSTGNTGWHETSTDTAGTFMEALVPEYFKVTPVDPINDSTHYWRYYRYPAGSNGCPVEKGAFYTIEAFGYENTANKPVSSPALVCQNRTWTGNGTTYLSYGFENE